MKINSSSIVITALLVIVTVLAINMPPKHYYPAIDVVRNDNPALPNETLILSLIFESRQSLSECEKLIGNISRILLEDCPLCSIEKQRCNASLTENERYLLTDAPIDIPSGRMSNGIVTYYSINQVIAYTHCQQYQKIFKDSSYPQLCYPQNRPRTKLHASFQISPLLMVLFSVATVVTWLGGWFIIRYEHLHAHFSHDQTDTGPQKFHSIPTPRIGGVAMLLGLTAGGIYLTLLELIPIWHEYGLLVLVALPAFMGGLIEDISKKVGVQERLLLTMFSGVSAVWILGAAISHLNIPIIDLAFEWYPFAVIFTFIAVGGVANSINIIDGYNGLAGGFSLLASGCLAYVANHVGDQLVLSGVIALAGATVGFLIWNWPKGAIFMGDGGAYLLGFLLAELSVLLVIRNPAVSPWFPLLLLIYPIFETSFSIYRKKFLMGGSPGKPDGLHLHMLIYKRIVRTGARKNRNNMTSVLIWGLSLFSILPAIIFWYHTKLLITFTLAFACLYLVIYWGIVRFKLQKLSRIIFWSGA